MSWFRVDDKWADSAKVDVISDVAARLWAICGTWCSKKENRRLDGFVPKAALGTITKRRWTDEVLELAIFDLVETSKVGGLYKVGLWEPVDGGWVFHDWEDYKPRESDEPSLSPTEVASVAGKASAAARKRRTGTAQPPNSSRTDAEQKKQFGEQFDRTDTSNIARTPEPPDPDPVPDQRSKSEAFESKDLSGSARAPSQLRQQRSSEPRRSESGPVSAPPPSGRRQHPTVSDDHAEPLTQIPPSAVNVARIPTRAERARRDFDSMPIDELAKAFQANPTWVAESAPQARPELAHVAQAWDQAVGLPHRPLGHACRDDATSKLLGLYADGATFEQLLQACKQAGKDPWLCGRTGAVGSPEDKRKRRIDVLTPKVLRRLLDSAEADKPTNASPAVLRMLEQEKLRESGVLR